MAVLPLHGVESRGKHKLADIWYGIQKLKNLQFPVPQRIGGFCSFRPGIKAALQSAAQQDCHMGQGSAVVFKQLVPELILALTVVDQGAAGEDDHAEQLRLIAGGALPAAHNGQEAVDGIQVTEIDVPLPQLLLRHHVGHMEVEKDGDYQVFHEKFLLPEGILKPCPGLLAGGKGNRHVSGIRVRLQLQALQYVPLDRTVVRSLVWMPISVWTQLLRYMPSS